MVKNVCKGWDGLISSVPDVEGLGDYSGRKSIKEPLMEGASESLDKLDTFRGTAPVQVPPKQMNKRRGKHDKA